MTDWNTIKVMFVFHLNYFPRQQSISHKKMVLELENISEEIISKFQCWRGKKMKNLWHYGMWMFWNKIDFNMQNILTFSNFHSFFLNKKFPCIASTLLCQCHWITLLSRRPSLSGIRYQISHFTRLPIWEKVCRCRWSIGQWFSSTFG